MHRHILEQAAAALDVLERRRRGVPRAQLNRDHIADLALDHRALDPRKVRVEAALQRSHQLDVRRAARVDRLDRLHSVRRDWLLAEDMLPHRGARLDLLGVVLRGRADPDGLDVRVVDHAARVARELWHFELLGGRLSLRDCRIGDDDWLRRRALGERLEVHQADAAGADDADVKHAVRQLHRRRAETRGRGCLGEAGVRGRAERVGRARRRPARGESCQRREHCLQSK
mmetsp:Transcript_17047/g.40670  ORF Transcript_17047/g.40670 Transcript_17047/m.40670 type:complete len:229 (-) Transcript_17047:11-697(-)